jgi:hypothetical protein
MLQTMKQIMVNMQNAQPQASPPTPKASESSMYDVQQPPHFLVLNDVTRYTTEELLDITAQFATDEEVIEPLPILGGREMVPDNSQAVPSGVTVQGGKDTKGGKKR